MACSIDGTTIWMTRGDTVRIELTLTDLSGNPYVPDAGDQILFTVKKSYKDKEALFVKEVDLTNLVLTIEPEDTNNLQMNKDYEYDMQLTKANGDIDTFITPSILHIAEEVGW